jgi:hypothetical protein
MADVHWHDGVGSASTPELLQGYARILGELRSRGIVRSANAPAGDYAEWLCWKAFGGTLEPNSTKSYDLLDAEGRTVQIKARVVSDPPKSGQVQTSPFRSWDFSHAAFVLLDERTYLVRQASLLPADVFARGDNLARRVNHVNGWCVYMTPAVMNHPSAVDITNALNAAAGADSALQRSSDNEECIHLLPSGECAICKAPAPSMVGRPRGEDRHRWTRDDEIVVAGAYLQHASVNLPATDKEELAQLIGCSFASVALKLGNIDAHLAGGGLTSGSKLMREVVDELAGMDSAARHRAVAEARARLAG